MIVNQGQKENALLQSMDDFIDVQDKILSRLQEMSEITRLKLKVARAVLSASIKFRKAIVSGHGIATAKANWESANKDNDRLKFKS